ncbi:hypothetical protein B0T10DRAFT_281602 [Thelonectria olida]|uniref:Uncharacterized protein n=1 Tax=Thelonectria olida TaxID=1576542 RepID=A0A9P8WAI0_9HYPO|nr:hypothetical protein B0T10DRAFT_281602 [Thelonectria olida]
MRCGRRSVRTCSRRGLQSLLVHTSLVGTVTGVRQVANSVRSLGRYLFSKSAPRPALDGPNRSWRRSRMAGDANDERGIKRKKEALLLLLVPLEPSSFMSDTEMLVERNR